MADFPLLKTRRGENPGTIPWAVAERAYEVYASRYGTRQSLKRIAERGGFSVEEMDEMHPAWRDEVAAIRDAAPTDPPHWTRPESYR